MKNYRVQVMNDECITIALERFETEDQLKQYVRKYIDNGGRSVSGQTHMTIVLP